MDRTRTGEVGPSFLTTEELVKKLLVLILAAGAGYVLWRKLNEDAEGRDLWSEVTDTVE
ncbi:DLW-39 family protein [Myceligenerans halotolerans]